MTLALFEGVGIEIESAVVDAETLAVRPVVDELLREAAGTGDWVEDVDDGAIGWSNELVAHVVELKTNGPSATWEGLAGTFRSSTARANARLAAGWNARLMPTGMHPFMDPARETRLWPHEHGPVYGAYDRLFDCRRHGWANVQSVHLNLPFADEDELARLLAAARLVLPLIPALAASSPVVEGRATGLLDNRLDFYRTNSARVPAMTGDVIPEPVYAFDAYRERVLAPITAQLAALHADPVLLDQEWTNARGAIVRFDRMAVEIRLIDAQECAAADLAVAAAISGLVRGLVEERWSPHAAWRDWPTAPLVDLLAVATREGPRAAIDDPAYRALFGIEGSESITAGELWRRVAPATFPGGAELERHLGVVLESGALAERILRALGDPAGVVERAALVAVWRELCDCLATGRSFEP